MTLTNPGVTLNDIVDIVIYPTMKQLETIGLKVEFGNEVYTLVGGCHMILGIDFKNNICIFIWKQ